MVRAVLLGAVFGWAATAKGQAAGTTVPIGIDARLMRYPNVSATQIAFVYAGDIWVAPKEGGLAMRLSSPAGEETFPRFSPDGSQIGFSGNYDGNTDLYVMPGTGGVPKRLTFHGAPDLMLGWYPDGKSILFASSRASERDRFNQLYRISVDGGLPEKLPVPYGEFGAISPDGKLLAYVPISVDFATWKRYRGGMNPAIWLFNLETFAAKDLTGNAAANSQPMWHGSTLYFLSDRDKNKRANIWALDTRSPKPRQITRFEQFDIHFPSIGPEDIVFENGGRLFLLDLATEKSREVHIEVVTDRATLKPHLEDVSRAAGNADISPSGKRVVLEARGEIFSVPAENGVVRNLTRSSGVAERFPTWSPDGKSIAYFTDRSGEYELAVRPAEGEGEERLLTRMGKGFRYRPFWSPDSKKIVFIDQAMRIQLYDLDRRELSLVDKELWRYQDELSQFRVNWSKDSRWLAYGHDQENLHTAIALYDTKHGKRHLVTSGYYDDDEPVFDPDGKYLFYRSGREFAPVYSDLDDTWIYPNTYRLMAVSLRKDVASPLAPRDDEEGEKKEEKSKKPDEQDHSKDAPVSGKRGWSVEDGGWSPSGGAQEAGGRDKSDKAKPEAQEESKDLKSAKPLEIDLEGFEQRGVMLPPKAGRFTDLAAVPGKLIYRNLPRAGAPDEKASLVFYDLEKRESKTILDEVDSAVLAAKGEKILVRRGRDYAIIEPKEGQKFDKKVPVSGLETMIDPAAEWRQLFTEAWRLERDYFYDPNLHGVDWNEMRRRYGQLLKDAVTRWDVNYVIGELIGELNSSHTYRGGGDVEAAPHRGMGYLGVDFSFENGAYRIKHILDAGAWDAEARSPLERPGIEVKEGDYLLAVDGIPLDPKQEPYSAFQGLADRAVRITVNDQPTLKGAREVLVQTLASEARLRHLAWIEKNRKRVETSTQGRVGYIYVPDTGQPGQSELVRQFRAQFNRAGLIIDERFNSGGQIPNRFVEMLGRKVINYWAVRDGPDWAWPQIAHNGPEAMLINGWSGSGGDCFPFYFRKFGLGPLIGGRTWGGLIGISGTPGLIDGGIVTVPTFGIYSTQGQWIIEGHGVDPDVAVVDDPGLMAKGHDPQLERAIAEVLAALKKRPVEEVKKPKYPVRSGK
jgi:tricorn protease